MGGVVPQGYGLWVLVVKSDESVEGPRLVIGWVESGESTNTPSYLPLVASSGSSDGRAWVLRTDGTSECWFFASELEARRWAAEWRPKGA